MRWSNSNITVLLAAALLCGPAAAADTERGRLLYQNHCKVCHTSTVHVRERKKARSWTDLEQWMHRWEGQLELGWSDEDFVDVGRYLNAEFYKFESNE